MKLIVGLGNPGRSYANHRHNVGFMVVDMLAGRFGIEVKRRSFGALVGEGMIMGERAMLVKPQTFMNLSGDAVGPLMRYYELPSWQMVVIHDDIDIEFGKLKLARAIGDGGHNGVRSIVNALGCNDFFRVRMGVGRPSEGMDAAEYVLRPFEPLEEKGAGKMVEAAADATKVLISRGLEAAQQIYHREARIS